MAPDENDEVDFRDWLADLEVGVVQGESGYEPGEFNVYSSHWRGLYDQGLTPREAWQRALDGSWRGQAIVGSLREQCLRPSAACGSHFAKFDDRIGLWRCPVCGALADY